MYIFYIQTYIYILICNLYLSMADFGGPALPGSVRRRSNSSVAPLRWTPRCSKCYNTWPLRNVPVALNSPGGVVTGSRGGWGGFWECWVWSLCLGLLIQAGSWDDNGWYLQTDTKVDCKMHIILRIIRQEKPVIARLQQASRVLSTAQLFEKEWLAETLVYGIHNIGIRNSAEVHTYCPLLAKM